MYSVKIKSGQEMYNISCLRQIMCSRMTQVKDKGTAFLPMRNVEILTNETIKELEWDTNVMNDLVRY